MYLVYYSPMQVLIMMDQKCNGYVKACLKKAGLIYKRFYHIVFLEICRYFNLIVWKLNFLHGGDISKFREEMECKFA